MTDVLTDKVVVTRKSHQCWGCGDTYEKGSKMRYNTYAEDGTMFSAYWCETCNHIMQNHYDYWDLQDGVGFGDIKQNDLELWESTKAWKFEREDDREGLL